MIGTHLRGALRFFRRQPGFVVAAVLCFALGIGANATLTGVADGLLFRPPPHVRAARQLFSIQRKFVHAGGSQMPSMDDKEMTLVEIAALEHRGRDFGGVAAYARRDLTLGRGLEARPATVVFATPSYFSVLGVRPAVGRFLSPEDDREGPGQHVAVLSQGLWVRLFGGSPNVIGRNIDIGRSVYTIVGVAPPGFRGVTLAGTDVWVPSSAALGELFDRDVRQFREMPWLQAVGRLREASDREAAQLEASAAMQQFYSEKFGPKFDLMMLVTLEPVIAGYGVERTTSARIALWLSITSLLVVAIACVNVASLLTARTEHRRREIAVRLALGCSRPRLVGELLSESLAVAFLGGTAGVVASRWGEHAVRALVPELRDAGAIVNGRVLAVAAMLSLACALITGLSPALRAGRSDVAMELKADPRQRTRTRFAAGSLLMAMQIAMSVALLTAAGLFVGSLRNVRRLDPGYQTENLLVATMHVKAVGYSDAEADALFRVIAERVRPISGVTASALAWTSPTVEGIRWPSFEVPGGSAPASSDMPRLLQVNGVTEEYLTAAGIPLRGGRWFTSADHAGARPVSVINDAMARYYFPAGDALGRCVKVPTFGRSRGRVQDLPCREIVGVVGDTRADLRASPHFQSYVPLDQRPDVDSRTLLVRTNGDPRRLIADVRRVMQGAAPDAPFADVRVASELLAPQVRPWRLGAVVFAAFGITALALVIGGLYGSFSYAVARRRREFGIRLALGASGGDVLRLVLGESFRVAVIGTAGGLLLALGLARAIRSLLFGIAAVDPLVLGSALLLVLVVACCATLRPALRASQVDPRISLGEE